MTMLNAARKYLELGYSVIPIRPKAKEPLIKWSEYTQRYATEKEISQWFESDENNVGIVTGKLSGLLVLDVDGKEGLESLQKISLSSNTIAATGKGKQLFYQPPTGMQISNSVRFLPGLDLRSEGGYVVAAPSIHPNGKRYLWLNGPLKSSQLPPFPDVLANIVKEKNSSQTYSEKAKPEGWVAEALKNLKEGNRDDTFASVVGKLHYQGMDKASIWTLLLPHARACGYTEQELNKTIQSVSRYSTGLPATEMGGSNIEQFLADHTTVSWLCNPVCPENSIGFAAGLPESYKTWVCMDLAVELARGNGLWLGLFPCQAGRVLFIDQERSKQETQRRFKGLLLGKGLRLDAIKENLFIRSGTTTRIDLDESYNAFRRELAEIRPKLVVIDSWITFHTSDENDRMTVQRVLERIKTLREEFKCTFLFIDHENKGAFQDMRDGATPTAFRMSGSVGKIAAAEFVLTVRRIDPITCSFHHTKSTLGPRVDSFAVHVVDTENGGIRVYGEASKA
jgi:hypothetical protein